MLWRFFVNLENKFLFKNFDFYYPMDISYFIYRLTLQITIQKPNFDTRFINKNLMLNVMWLDTNNHINLPET